MSLRHVTINGRKVWQARVAYAGLRRSTIRPTRAEVPVRPKRISSAT